MAHNLLEELVGGRVFDGSVVGGAAGVVRVKPTQLLTDETSRRLSTNELIGWSTTAHAEGKNATTKLT